MIDEDQGKSAAVAEARRGFAELIMAVGRGEAGIVVSLEVSRLARNSPDWHHLIYLSRWTDSLITDGETIYDPKLSADRMVLGIRGQVSELELDHSIQRMIEARWNKARRGDVHHDSRFLTTAPQLLDCASGWGCNITTVRSGLTLCQEKHGWQG